MPFSGDRQRVRLRRSPCGERGLKFRAAEEATIRGLSLPVRGAWIEIPAPPLCAVVLWSLPVRGAWIEISFSPFLGKYTAVAPRAGSVD